MCGITAILSDTSLSDDYINKIKKEFMKIKHRGPDDTQYYINNNIFVGFHRLSINDLSVNGNQPFIIENETDKYVLICNGEIYNYKSIINSHKYTLQSSSDCEVIIHMFKDYGFKKTIEQLDGVFSCILVHNDIMYVARDPIGVRPLFMGKKDGKFLYSSEIKSINNLCDNIEQFPPGSIWNSKDKKYYKYYNIDILYNKLGYVDKNNILYTIKHYLTEAVKKRIMSDRPIGCLLSGGLDSSLVAAILQQNISTKLKTFSIGLEGASDLEYAKKVADYIGSDHTEVIISEEDMFNAIPQVIKSIESYDTTTIRASTPMYLLSKYIHENTNITVIYSGEGSDEASGSYLYFHKAPTYNEFRHESNRLMKDLHYFDVLRCDRTTAAHSLEVRVPFLDKDFLNYYMNIDPRFKHPDYGDIEKYMLRKAFDNRLLPEDVLWRTKEAMSDGISKKENSWFSIIQNKVNKIYTDAEFKQKQNKYEKNKPMLKESLYYRELFANDYKLQDNIIPYYWLPKWCGDIVEPSARILKI